MDEDQVIKEELEKVGGKFPTDTRQVTDLIYAIANRMHPEYSRELEAEGLSDEEIARMVGG